MPVEPDQKAPRQRCASAAHDACQRAELSVAFLTNRPIARIETVATEIDCRTASRVGIWTVIPTAPATGAAREVKARYSFYDRVQDGGWKIDHLHSSMMRFCVRWS